MIKKITHREMIAEFLQFIKENNALSKYKKNLYKQRKCEFHTMENKINPLTINTFKKMFNYGKYIELINYAFNWSSTLEGHSYWENLDCKWRQKIIHEQIEVINEKI